MGGSVGLSLASGRHGVRPRRVLAFGIKFAWTPEELAGLERLAVSPPRILAAKDEAVTRFLKVSGLIGLVDPASPIAAAGVVEGAEGWRLAADPAAASIGPPDMGALTGAAACPVRLAAGEHDPMSRAEGLRRWDPDATAFAGLGHNAMVEGPAAVWAWARTMIAQSSPS
jgi:pimeloyl-ACP methyl ester carboxylesterase